MASSEGPDSPTFLDTASHLVGKLEACGTTILQKDNASNNGVRERLIYTTQEAEASSSDESLRGELDGLDPLPRSGSTKSPKSDNAPKRLVNGEGTNLTIQLEKTDQAGQYVLSTTDPELRAILKQGFERSKEGDIKKKRSQFSDLVFTQQFTAFDRQNPTSAASTFHGFFSLFWMGTALMLIRVAANNWRSYGSIFGRNEIVRLMLSRDIMMLGAVDGLMCGITIMSLLIQKMVFKDYISWGRSGWIIQNIWQTLFLAAFIAFPRYRDWPWTHSVFITLHTITMLMKQHSYAFYNGYLSQLYKKRKILKEKLVQLDGSEFTSPVPGSPNSTAHATSYFDAKDFNQISRRRKSIPAGDLKIGPDVDHDIASIASALENDAILSFDQVRSLRKLIQWEVESLSEELKGSCKKANNSYPKNLTTRDFYSYIPLPTVVYELEYPRQEKINWFYVAEKTAATFGVIGVMIVVSTAWIYPVVLSILKMKEDDMPLKERLKEFPWAFSDLLFPFMMEYLLAWYVIWECVLNVLAELTLFADRGFYSDWWNSTSWDQFARDWNRPVHNFLLRFAYHSSITAFRLSRSSATLVTFLLSACVHELVMAVIFGKIRGYLLAMQMLQLPLVMLSRKKFLKDRDILGNLVFWLGIFVGPSFLCSLYLFL